VPASAKRLRLEAQKIPKLISAAIAEAATKSLALIWLQTDNTSCFYN
jgi:hypothetical protein